MPISTNNLHPYRFSQLVTEYDDRVARIAQMARRLRRDSGQRSGSLASHDRMLADEFGSMTHDEFTHRVRLAKAVNELTQEWLAGGSRVFDVFGAAADDERVHGPDAEAVADLDPRSPLFLYFGEAADLNLAKDPNRYIEGAYVTSLGESDLARLL